MNKLKAIKLISFLWVGSLTGAALAFFTQVILAKGLGVAEFGRFSSALATVTLLAPLAGFGVAPLWLKEFGLEGWGALRWINASFKFILGSTVLVLILVFSWASLGVNDENSKLIILILSACVLGQVGVELVSSKFQLEERYFTLACWQLLPHLFRFSVSALLIWQFSDIFSIELAATVYSAVAIFFLLLSITPLFNLARGELTLKGHATVDGSATMNCPNWASVASNAWPFGFAAFAHLIYYQSDIILIKYMVGDEAAGHYNVAFIVISAVYLLPSVIYQKFLLPKIHRWAAHDKEKLHLIYRKGNLAMFAFGIIAMTGVWIFGELFITLLFGQGYIKAAAFLMILAFSIPMISVAFNAGAILTTNEHAKTKVKYMLIVAALNLALNLWAIPKWGAQGAAFTTVFSNFALLTLYIYGSEKIISRKK